MAGAEIGLLRLARTRPVARAEIGSAKVGAALDHLARSFAPGVRRTRSMLGPVGLIDRSPVDVRART